jgi:hypothetical protein
MRELHPRAEAFCSLRQDRWSDNRCWATLGAATGIPLRHSPGG